MICSNCRNKFTPDYPGQSVCSFICKMEKLRKDRDRARAKNAVRFDKPKAKIPLITPRRKQLIRIYGQIKALWMQEPENQVCAAREELKCCKPGDRLELHHAAGRQNLMLLYEPFWIPLCHTAHRKVTEESAWAVVRGYSIKRNNRPKITLDDIQSICDEYGVELKLTPAGQ